VGFYSLSYQAVRVFVGAVLNEEVVQPGMRRGDDFVMNTN